KGVAETLKSNIRQDNEYRPLTPALRRQRQKHFCELEASLVYIVSSRTAGAIEKPPSQKKKKNKKGTKPQWYCILPTDGILCLPTKFLVPRTCPVPLSPLRKFFMSWRDGSAVKSTDCSSRGPEFKFQKPHNG
ncbi:mCG1041168, partial [Mus musculus]